MLSIPHTSTRSKENIEHKGLHCRDKEQWRSTTGKDGEKQKEPNLYHTKEKERNLMPEGLYLIVEEESLQKADCAVQQQNLCSPQWSSGSSLVPPINNDPRLVKEHI